MAFRMNCRVLRFRSPSLDAYITMERPELFQEKAPPKRGQDSDTRLRAALAGQRTFVQMVPRKSPDHEMDGASVTEV
jgi:hypothetical protein